MSLAVRTDFTVADAEMKQARAAGFDMPILSYCGFGGLNIYTRDLGAMKAAGFTDYAEFLKAVFSAVQKHADENHWLSVYYVLGDEPAGKEDILAATENAQAFRKAFPSGPPWFTLFGSCVAKARAARITAAPHIAITAGAPSRSATQPASRLPNPNARPQHSRHRDDSIWP